MEPLSKSTHNSSDFEKAKYWFFLGLNSLQQNKYKIAENAFIESLKIIPDRVSTLTNLASVLIKLNKFDEALSVAEKSIAIEHTNPEGWLNLGLAEKHFKNHEVALSHFEQAIQFKPDFAEAWSNRGITLYELKRYEEALAHYDRAIQLNVNFVEAWSNKGLTLYELKRYEESLEHYDQAIRLNVNFAEAWLNKGLTLNELKRYEEALEHYDHAIRINPNLAEAWSNKGITLNWLERNEEALTHFTHAIQLNQNFTAAWSHKGITLHKLKRYEEALAHHDHAIWLKPDLADAWASKGVTLNEINCYEDALTHYDHAIALKPDFADTWSKKGVTLYFLKRYDEALAHFDHALQLNPEFYFAFYNKSFIKLLLEDFKNGWDLYEYRWKVISAPPYRFPHMSQLSSLDNIKNKTILVWHEQGYGDSIQFSRYLPMLTRLGAHVTFEAPKKLLRFFQDQFECEITSTLDENRVFDFEIPLLSLPRLFNTDINNIPSTSEIILNSSKINKWKESLNLSTQMPNIGIAVSGNPQNLNNHNRSMALSEITPLLGSYNIYLIQKGMSNLDKEFLQQHPEITYLGDQISDFSDTAAIIHNLDLTISVCTSVIHLAGTLNKKSYAMLSWSADWRWLLERSDTPWYPSVKLFRQKAMGDWASVIHEIKHELQHSDELYF